MNIMLICSDDPSNLAQLNRFIYFAYESNFNYKYYLLLVSDINTKHISSCHKFESLMVSFDKIITCQFDFNKHKSSGQFLFYFDYLKTTLLDIFNITEGLYVDIDVDIVRDLSELERISKENNNALLWTEDPVYSANRNYDKMAKIINPEIDLGPPYACSGFLYLHKKNYTALFKDAINKLNNYDPKILRYSFIPGSGIWNTVIKENSNFMLDRSWHVLPLWDPEHISEAKCYHYSGPIGKKIRPHVKYEGDGIKIGNKK